MKTDRKPADTRYDGTLRVVMWLDAFWSVAFVVAGVAAVPVVAVVALPPAVRLTVGVLALVAGVFLAACGAITAVLLMARMRDGHYDPPVRLRLPLPAPMRPDLDEAASAAGSCHRHVRFSAGRPAGVVTPAESERRSESAATSSMRSHGIDPCSRR